MQDKVAQTIAQVDLSDLKVPMISVYGPNQIEYPGKYVARICDLEKITNTVIIKDSYEDLQQDIINNRPYQIIGHFIDRNMFDNPALIGTWV